MDLTNQDEIEYFGFLAVAFTTDLREELQECLNEIFNNNHINQKIQSHINESFKKNFFIFNNFVLRNILKFPTNFKLERKVTDKTIETDVSAILSSLLEKQNKILELKAQVLQYRKNMAIQETRCSGYKKLLENQPKFRDLCTGAKEIKNFFKETNELYEKYKAGGRRKDSEFEKLMEYKNIKSEYYRTERDKLLAMCNFEVLEYINKSL